MNSPSCRNFHKYTTHELEKMLRDDISNENPMNADDIIAVLDILDSRADGPNNNIPKAHDAWLQFQKYYIREKLKDS